MGRYYNGDIEGKFWFGVQSSSDADFFGVEGNINYLNYHFNESDIPRIKNGIKECKKELGTRKKELDTFFEKNNGYNDVKLVEQTSFVKSKRNRN